MQDSGVAVSSARKAIKWEQAPKLLTPEHPICFKNCAVFYALGRRSDLGQDVLQMRVKAGSSSHDWYAR
jgi:hypothetical protein